MQILVMGSGLMGPAAAYNALTDPRVAQVTLADKDAAQLAAAQARLTPLLANPARLSTAVVDLADQQAAASLMAQHDAVVAALPSAIIPHGVRAAMAARTPWIDLSWPADAELPELKRLAEENRALVIPGCGVEPGLTEIMARYLAEKLDRADELHIKCGGIPLQPDGPLNYRIVFGGKRLPLREYDARIAEHGALRATPRYSGVETFQCEGVGEVEAWHEGFMPWLLELDALKSLKLGTQKTVRWPGYAAKATALRELGLLSVTPVDVDGVAVAPKYLVDAVLYPHVKMQEDDRDLTIFRVEASGVKDGFPRRYAIDMVDRFDETLGFTSMARVTAFTGAIVARMAARGAFSAIGWVTPEKLLTGDLFRELVAELARAGVTFTETVEKTGRLES
ncbi:saccharopine dehydrogenase C-terminal domain-containing protein [Caldilinea sp.]|uniref:saccharopine dehydrogenase family protein n=1 Tax=Caldilinea sp. TaxID=2293560 RepID=UPI002CAFDF7B|nr:saccharopine dehydrogenase NADP-binding domain-containing protein [Anaerolineales bacterium]HQY90060.1 saccharopine dehydrogenase C-terminal domain-containing protein [Caldilinea sp.]